MAFTLAEPFIDKVDSIAVGYVAQLSQNAIAAISPIISVGLTISFLMFGYLIMRGAVQVPYSEFINKCLSVSIICGFAMAGGLYQTQLAGIIIDLPDDMAGAIVANADYTSAGQLIDEAASNGFDVASSAFEKSGFLSGDGLLYGLFGIFVVLITAVVVGIGATLIVLSKFVLGILAGLGPLFIFALLFKPTAKLFESWVGQILNYTILVVMFSAVFTFLMDIFSGYLGDMALDGTQNVAYTLGGSVILAVATIVVLLQLPALASSVSQGMSLGYLHEMRAVRSGAASAGSAASSAGRSVYQRGQAQADGSRGQARGAVPAMARGAQRAAGYFRNRGKAA